MQLCDTLILPGWCIPVEPAGTILTEHAVAIGEGRIIDILPFAEAKKRYRPGVTVARPGHVLLPGLVNVHCHAAMTLLRGMAEDLPLERWLSTSVWPAEKRWISAEMVRDGTRHAMAEMLRAGITCFADQYLFPEVVARAASEHHVRAVVGTPVLDFATAWADDATDCLGKGAELVHDAYADDPLVTSVFAPHSSTVTSDETFRQLRVFADQLDTRIHMHLHESLAEVEESVARTGKRPLERLGGLGLLNSSLLAVHAVHLTDEEIGRMAAAGVGVAHCPRSNLKLASGIARIGAMRDAGVGIGLGTDGAASNNVLDILGEMRCAALLAKGSSGDATLLTAAEALRMATLDGAAVLGLADSIGSIEVAKWADLTCIDLQTLNSQPVHDPMSQVVYTAHAEQVTDVWVAGRHQLDERHLTQFNEADLLARSVEWRERIAAAAEKPERCAT